MDKKMIPFFFIILTLTACTQSLAATSTPTQPPPATATATLSLPSATPLPNATTVPIDSAPADSSAKNPYAVILVAADDVLNVRAAAGVDNAIVGTLQPTASNVMRTGPESMVGGESWVEIQNPGGGNGWVNANYLTEYVTPSTFCGDSLVTSLLQNFEVAVKSKNGDLLKSLVSPRHGLDVTFIRNGTVANYSPEEAGWVFDSTYSVDWGLGAGSGEPVAGTFSNVVLPTLQTVFEDLTLFCDEIKLGGATYLVERPTEYTNINFYSLHNPDTDQYSGMDWQTWLTGVEYVQGKPYLISLQHYQWEP